jgi:sulfate transport system substrate-binding protein
MKRFVLAALLAALVAAAPSAAGGGKLTLVAYSTPNVAFSKLIPAFQSTAAGKGVEFDQSYGASEVQAKAVVAGLPADIVDLSLQPDVEKLVKAGLVAKSWNRNKYNGFVTKSVVVFVLRNGNPKHIRTWDDLAKPGLQIVTPNPFSSGGARWNVLAAYGSQLREGKSKKQAEAFVGKLFKNVVSQDTSGRNALQTFLSGRGDVLLTYENEAILAQQQHKPVYYLIPKATLQIENPLAVIKSSRNKSAANAFYKFLYTAKAQTIFAETGYRPVVQSVGAKYRKQFPPRPQLFTIKWLGGWDKLTPHFFDPSNGVMAKIERSLGVGTG